MSFSVMASFLFSGVCAGPPVLKAFAPSAPGPGVPILPAPLPLLSGGNEIEELGKGVSIWRGIWLKGLLHFNVKALGANIQVQSFGRRT